MDRFKWYASHSVMMDQIALSEGRMTFIDNSFREFSELKTGINSLLYVYFRENVHSNRYKAFYEIFFSIDGKLLEIRDLNPAVDGDPFYVYDVKNQKKINNSNYNQAMNFILDNIVMRDGFNVRSQLNQHKSVALLQVDYDDYLVSTNEIIDGLRGLIDGHFTNVIGPMY